MLSTFALVLAVVLGNTVPSASGALAITVTAGQWVTLSVSGIVRVDTYPAGIALASPDADSVRIHGLRPGLATLMVTTSNSVEARPIQVAAPSGATMSLVPQAADCPALAPIAAADASHIAIDAPDLAVEWTPSRWRLEWTPPDVRVLASSVLETPLQQLGVPLTRGLQAEWHDEWQLIAGDRAGLVGYRVPGAGAVAVGESALGPAGFADMTLGGAKISAAALQSQGQLVGAGQATVNAGSVNVGYTTGPAGGSPTIQFHGGNVSASAGAAGRAFQVGLGIALAPGFSVDSAWTTAGEWRLHLAIPIGDGAVAQAGASPGSASVSYAAIGSKAQDTGCLPGAR